MDSLYISENIIFYVLLFVGKVFVPLSLKRRYARIGVLKERFSPPREIVANFYKGVGEGCLCFCDFIIECGLPARYAWEFATSSLGGFGSSVLFKNIKYGTNLDY